MLDAGQVTTTLRTRPYVPPAIIDRGRVLFVTDDDLTHLRRLASDGLRATAYTQFAPRDPKEPPPSPETLGRRAFCEQILREVPAR